MHILFFAKNIAKCAEIMNTHTFYYDESGHTSKINENYLDLGGGQADSYIGVFVGWADKDAAEIEAKFKRWEEQQRAARKIPPDKELKGTSIKASEFMHGIASFHESSLQLYDSFFELLLDEKIFVQVSILSKISYFIEQFTEQICPNIPIEEIRGAVYTLAKALVLHRPEPVWTNLLTGNTGTFVEDISCYLKKCVANDADFSHKTAEIDAFEKYIQFIAEYGEGASSIHVNQLWDYGTPFETFGWYCEEKNIPKSRIHLCIDNEERTVDAARKFRFGEVTAVDSRDSVGVRIADFLSNFIGRMTTAIDKTTDYHCSINGNKLDTANCTEFRILPGKFFKIKSHSFYLYQKIGECLLRKEWWKITGNIYSDAKWRFMGLLNYFCTYDSFEDYCKIDEEEHSKWYNDVVCELIIQHFGRL